MYVLVCSRISVDWLMSRLRSDGMQIDKFHASGYGLFLSLNIIQKLANLTHIKGVRME